MENYTAVIGAIIGGFLAAISGVSLYFFQKFWDRRNLKKLFLSAIKDDLRNSIPLYEKIKNTGKSQKFIPFESTNGLKKSRQIYEKYTEHLIIITPYELRKRIFDYYLQSSTIIERLESYQNRVYAIENRYRDTLKHIKEENPTLSEQEINQKTFQLNENEAQEFMWLKADTLEQLNNLDAIKMEARLILDKLE